MAFNFASSVVSCVWLCYMMTITYQTIGSSKIGLLLSVLRQGVFYLPFILVLPPLCGVKGIYFAQPAADLLTIIKSLLLVKPMKKIASKNRGTEECGDLMLDG